MPPITRVLAALSALVGLLVLLYSILLIHQPLLGIGIAFALFIAAILLATGGRDRETVVVVVMAVTVVYGLFTFQLPAAIVAACVVYLTAWVTSSNGPFDAAPLGLFQTTPENDTEHDSNE